MRNAAVISVLMASAFALGACTKNADRYMEIAGGGFLFNYRLAEATVGLLIAPTRELPEGAIIEVTFENPAGGPPIVMRKDASQTKSQIEFTTPPLSGIVANKDYLMNIRLLASNGSEIEHIDKNFHSELNQSVLPPKPLTIGPGYTPNPDLDPKDAPGQL